MDGLLFEIGVFSRLLLQLQRDGLLLDMNAANIGFDVYKTTSKNTTQMFQSRNMLKCRIVLKKNTNIIIYCNSKKAHCLLFEMGFSSKLLLQTQERDSFRYMLFPKLSRAHWASFRRFWVLVKSSTTVKAIILNEPLFM